MPDGQFYRVTQQISLVTLEAAQFSWSMIATDTGSANAGAAAFQSSLAAATSFKAIFPSGVTFVSPKLSLIDISTGKVVSTSTAGTSFAGTGGTNALPPQIAICASLLTDFAGGSNRGRMYLPGPVNGQTTTAGKLTTAASGVIATALSAAFAACLATGGGIVIQVYSPTLRSLTTVTAVGVGDVLDTQRSRRNSLLEIRAESSFA